MQFHENTQPRRVSKDTLVSKIIPMGKPKRSKKREPYNEADDVDTNSIAKSWSGDAETQSPNLSFLTHMELKAPDWTAKQKHFLRLLTDTETNMVVMAGPAGTSKTFCAVFAALQMLQAGHIDKIVYVRSVVESASKSMGALPGTADEKFGPYMRPLVDKMDEIIHGGRGLVDKLVLKKVVEGLPVNLLRGGDFKYTAVIIDEAQNMTFPEIVTVSTRLGKGSRLFVCGDFNQADIGGKTGFNTFAGLFEDQISVDNGVHICEFDKSDIMRSEFLKFLVEKFETVSSYANR